MIELNPPTAAAKGSLAEFGRKREKVRLGLCLCVEMWRAQERRADLEDLIFLRFLLQALKQPSLFLVRFPKLSHDCFPLVGLFVPMGIIKIRQLRTEKDNLVQECPHNCTLDKVMQEESLLSSTGHGNDHDDSELLDAGCEYALLDDEIFGVPCELYDLQDLKEILSLNSWNSFLTEEERLHLSAYLPDMDCETFVVTMMELLRGANLFFGSPLETLFHRLKGGFYSPQVTHLREGSNILQKRGYYHSLRRYHERMAQKFGEMRKAWSNCQPSNTVEERIEIWNNKKYRKPVLLVDLNAIPADEDLLRKAEKKRRRIPALKKKKNVDEEASTHVHLMNSNGTALSSRIKAKGVLKIKPIEMNSTPKQVVLSLPTESSEPFRRPPKGVLKIKPKRYTFSEVERQRTIQGQGNISLFRVPTTRLSPSHFSSPWREEDMSNKLPFLHQSVRDEGVFREDILKVDSGLYNNKHNSLSKMKAVRGMRMFANDSGNFTERFDRRQTAALCSSSTGLYESTSDHYHANVSEPLPRNSITVADNHQNYLKYQDDLEHRFGDENSGEGVSRSLILPITYKRKKPYTKLNAFQANLEPVEATGAPFHPMEKTKPIKIRVKGWNEYDSQYKQGMLNGLHHGSPST
ncbi:hypothetical protein AXF42_Ash010676 [Apostasia shenzhenica]|uniref:DEUBAD domain-containing protein n=1 Tax=Apostasia shenzhenica TaxID=1088818 RepID=A0A2I0A6S5_9ASPA|nr:hypothetical protein AXF42_Ash010676 [Apostasia shenzhenica]